MFLERNLYPINFGKTHYRINSDINLGNFQNIVTNNDHSRTIEFTIDFVGEYEFPKIDVFKPVDYEQNHYLKWILDNDLRVEPFFAVFKRIMEDNWDVMGSLIQDTSFLGKGILDARMHFEFRQDDNDLNFKSIKVTDNINASELQIDAGIDDINKYFFFRNDGLTKLFGNKFNFDSKPFKRRSINLYYGKETEKLTSLLDENFFWNLPSISEILSINFNKIEFPFESHPTCYEWEQFSDDQKLEAAYDVFKFIYISQALIPRALKNFFAYKHIPTTRELPKERYLLTNGEFNLEDYYGFIPVIHFAQKSKEHRISSEQWSSEQRAIQVYDNLSSYLEKLGFEFKLNVWTDENIGELLISNKELSFNLREASSGVIQLMPILIGISVLNYSGFNTTSYLLAFDPTWIKWYSQWNDKMFTTNFNTLLIEQPELHLHPKLQSKFSNVLTTKMADLSNDDHIFIETHSEHLIRKIQVQIAKGEVVKDNIGVYYFENKDGITKVIKHELDENGLFKKDWPDGFFDDSVELTMELFEALRKRKN